jgi:3-hydroxymyristoyl/3-hydroxydecanoyl-(acyl carrier protein) dehydratase
VDAELLETLVRRLRRAHLTAGGAPMVPMAAGRAEIARVLPHRAPFLLLDELTAIDLGGRRMSGRRAIDPADPILAGHFPGEPIYPGVLQIEMMGQLGLCLLALCAAGAAAIAPDATPRQVRALKVHHALFAAPVLPGDALEVGAHLVEHDGLTGIVAGQIHRGDTLCSLLVMEVYLVDA